MAVVPSRNSWLNFHPPLRLGPWHTLALTLNPAGIETGITHWNHAPPPPRLESRLESHTGITRRRRRGWNRASLCRHRRRPISLTHPAAAGIPLESPMQSRASHVTGPSPPPHPYHRQSSKRTSVGTRAHAHTHAHTAGIETGITRCRRRGWNRASLCRRRAGIDLNHQPAAAAVVYASPCVRLTGPLPLEPDWNHRGSEGSQSRRQQN